MKSKIYLSALALLSSVSAFAGWENKGFSFEGVNRTYRVYTPANYNTSNPASVVLTLHGLGDNMTNFSGIGFNNVADTANIIVVVPQAVADPMFGTAWNSGAGMAGIYPNATVNDVGFISALIDTIQANYSTQPENVFCTGFSMGGFMTERLAFQLNNKINSYASVAGTFGSGLVLSDPGRAINIAHFHGTADPTVTYTPGTFGASADSVINFWVANNSCDTAPVHTALPDTKADGLTVDHYLYSGGNNGTEVELFKVNNAAHIWLTDLNDISYTLEIWKFFYKHKSATTGIDNLNKESLSLSLSPNPVATQATLHWGKPLQNAQIKICDVSGRVIRTHLVEKQQQSATIDVSGLSNGIYTVLFQSSMGIGFSKLVVTK